jgi:hypothetical protein
VLINKLTKIAAFVLGLSLSQFAASQNKPQSTTSASASAPAPAPTISISQEVQWEYLVVSYGKTLFGGPDKTLAYRSIGLVATAQEASEIQQSLDILGRFGWEVITIVGSIGGDQQIVLKRRYEKNRVANESIAIFRGRELYLKDLIDIFERARKIREESELANAASRNQPKLIDLDAKEREDRRLQLTAELISTAKSTLNDVQGVKDPVITARVSDSEGRFRYIEVRIDLTDLMLKDGNTYRATEVKNWLNSVLLSSFKKPFNSPTFDIQVKASATITFNGKAEIVGEEKIDYSLIFKRWR